MLSVDAADDEVSDGAAVPPPFLCFSLLTVTAVLTTASSPSQGSSVMKVPVEPVLMVVVTGVTVNVNGIEVIASGMASDVVLTGTRAPPLPVLEPLSTLSVAAGSTMTRLPPRPEPDLPRLEPLARASSSGVGEPSLPNAVSRGEENGNCYTFWLNTMRLHQKNTSSG